LNSGELAGRWFDITQRLQKITCSGRPCFVSNLPFPPRATRSRKIQGATRALSGADCSAMVPGTLSIAVNGGRKAPRAARLAELLNRFAEIQIQQRAEDTFEIRPG
jgi:hypothetical protein